VPQLQQQQQEQAMLALQRQQQAMLALQYECFACYAGHKQP
jgi:hypothetical protein